MTYLSNSLKAFESDDYKIVCRKMNSSGSYRFYVDIDLGSGFTLPLLCNEIEAMQILTVAKVRYMKQRLMKISLIFYGVSLDRCLVKKPVRGPASSTYPRNCVI